MILLNKDFISFNRLLAADYADQAVAEHVLYYLSQCACRPVRLPAGFRCGCVGAAQRERASDIARLPG